jgi:phosphate transport system permease protein
VQPTDRKSITGLSFSRKPRRSVMWVDDLARRLITLSGIGSIVAVSLVGLFLVWVVLPLFTSTGLEQMASPVFPAAGQSPARDTANPPLHQVIDNYGSLVWSLHADGTFQVRELEHGTLIDTHRIRAEAAPTAWSMSTSGTTGRGALGFADGSVITLQAGFAVKFMEDEDVPERLQTLQIGERMVWERGLAERTPEGQLRVQELELVQDPAVAVSGEPVVLLEVSETTNGLVLLALDTAGDFHDRKITWRKNLLTGEIRSRSRGGDLGADAVGIDPAKMPTRMAMNDAGDMVLLVFDDGESVQLRRDDEGEFAVVDRQDLIPDATARLTSLAFLAGRVSLAVGDDHGGLNIWFPVRDEVGRDVKMEPVHDLSRGTVAVTALRASGRSRMLAAGYADGSVGLFQVTGHRFLGEGTLGREPVLSMAISPREDLFLAVSESDNALWVLDAPHPDISPAGLLRPIWYEGYAEPAYVWQSSAASDSFEPKLSLIPLIFGTLKATFYSMLFGLPLALLAAMYTSEFVHKKVRTRIKPVIEIMASLPSVVLGFLAALVMAPFVERVVVEILAVLFMAPFFLLLGAHLWQMLPRDVAMRIDAWRPVAVFGMILVGLVFAWQAGPTLERIGFAGDAKAWLDGRVGSGLIGWFLLLLPVAALLVGWLNVNYGEGVLRRRGHRWGPFSLSLLDLVRFLISTVATGLLALFVGWLLHASGWDPRGSAMGTYVQRNALVVGFAMGFAVIPIIYSLAEDALSSVPDHLRAASMGAGATPWQTAIRVIVPPAMSGLFSAGMIGLGRAVGETMIVLMAAGNTPIMEWNIFAGFRTLSANLAVELPEAVQNSTHYRTLFLAALTLFLMTFVLNTIAEGVRLHFRRKASRL